MNRFLRQAVVRHPAFLTFKKKSKMKNMTERIKAAIDTLYKEDPKNAIETTQRLVQSIEDKLDDIVAVLLKDKEVSFIVPEVCISMPNNEDTELIKPQFSKLKCEQGVLYAYCTDGDFYFDDNCWVEYNLYDWLLRDLFCFIDYNSIKDIKK